MDFDIPDTFEDILYEIEREGELYKRPTYQWKKQSDLHEDTYSRLRAVYVFGEDEIDLLDKYQSLREEGMLTTSDFDKMTTSYVDGRGGYLWKLTFTTPWEWRDFDRELCDLLIEGLPDGIERSKDPSRYIDTVGKLVDYHSIKRDDVSTFPENVKHGKRVMDFAKDLLESDFDE